MGDEDDGWLPLSIQSYSRRFWHAIWVVFPVLGFGYLAFEAGSLVGDLLQANGAARVGLVVVFSVIPFAAGAWVWLLLNPVPHVDFDRGLLRIRGRSIPIAEVDSARRLMTEESGHVDPPRDDVPLGIRLGKNGGPQVSILIVRGEEGSVERELSERLAEVIRRSIIRYPQSSYDPTGRFAQYNFPEHFDKDGAIEYVLGPAHGAQ